MYSMVDLEQLFGIFQNLTKSEKTTPKELATNFIYNIWFS